ncbi:MAG: response regulator [Bacteroidota bacterium]
MKKFIKSNFSNRNNGDSKSTDFSENLEFNDFVDYSAIGIFKMNIDTDIEYANQALAQILDYKSRSDLVGINFQNDLISESNDWEKIRSKLYQQRIAKNFIVSLKQNNGNSILVRVDMRSATDEYGTPSYFEGSITDISDFITNVSDLNAKQVFEMAHKIKTPINSIVGFLTLIEQGLFNSEDELKDFSKKARQSANVLVGLVDGMNEKISQIKLKKPTENVVVESNDNTDKNTLTKENESDVVTNQLEEVEVPEDFPEESAEQPVSTIENNGTVQAEGKKILLVEDNPISQNVEMRLLKDSGYSVVAVTSGEDAIKAVKTNEYSLVLMDVEMPDMDGLKATKVIRELESPINRIPIIAVTAHSSMKDRERCLSSGMNDYIAKPININFMKMTIDQWLKK